MSFAKHILEVFLKASYFNVIYNFWKTCKLALLAVIQQIFHKTNDLVTKTCICYGPSPGVKDKIGFFLSTGIFPIRCVPVTRGIVCTTDSGSSNRNNIFNVQKHFDLSLLSQATLVAGQRSRLKFPGGTSKMNQEAFF